MDNGTKSWYQSTTIQGAIISILVFLGQILKIEIGTEEISTFIIALFGVVGAFMVVYGRIKAKYIIK